MKVIREHINLFNCYLIVIFLFTFIFSVLIPFGGDDWGNYLQKGSSLIDAFNIAKGFYFSWEGRFFSRIFDTILIPIPFLWSFLNAIAMTLLFYFIVKIIDVSKKYYPFVLLCILLVDIYTFAQVYVWKTGNITYFLPMVYAFFLIFLRRKLFFSDEVSNFKKIDFLSIPLTFIFSMFVENVTVGIIFVCGLNIVLYYIKSKKVDWPFVLNLIVAIMGFCLMIFSPGTANRMDGEVEFSSLSFIGKFLWNIPNLIDFTFLKNSFLIILMSFVMIVIILKKFKNKLIKSVFIVYVTVFPLFTAMFNFLSYFLPNLPSSVQALLNSNNLLIEIYWIIYAIAFVYLICSYFVKEKYFWYFIILALVGNGSMMMSPVWGGRTACFTTFMLYMVVIMAIKKFDLKIFDNKKLIVFLTLLSFSIMFMFLVYGIIIYNLNIDRNKYINYQLKQGKNDKIEVIILPSYFTWNLNTWGSDGDFAYNFKSAYGIPRNAELIYVKKSDVKVNIDSLQSSPKMRF